MTKTGIVLAGGFATRFDGGDKTLAALDGRPLIGHVVDALRPVVETIVVSCRAEQVEKFEAVLDEVVYRPDPTPDEGPLAGLAAAITGVDAEAVAVTTADRPCVPAGLYEDLFATLDRDGEGVVIRDDGVRQPAPAVFETAALRTAVERRRAGGDRRLRSVLSDLDVTELGSDRIRERWGEMVLADVNTEAELDRLRSGRCQGANPPRRSR